MKVNYFHFYKKVKNLLWLGFGTGIFLLISSSANAVLITFDELDLDSYRDESGSIKFIANEYESQGVKFNGSVYLIGRQEWAPEIYPSNYIAGLGFDFEFVGEKLPIYVSFTLGSSMGSAVFIDVLGPYYSKSVISAGEIHGMTDNHGTEYIPNQFFAFDAGTGISSVRLSGQGGVYIENLSYFYTLPVQVPEPSALILFALGFLGLAGSRLRTSIYSSNIHR